MDAHLLQLRELAPLEAEVRATVELPTFQTILSDENPQVKSVRASVNNLAEGRGGVREQQRLRENERLAVLIAAEQLARVAIRNEAQLVKARRLHEFLSDATGCTSIPLYEPEQLDGVSLAEANRNLGTLWLWYVNEVGATNRAWNAYRRVQPR